MFSYSISKKTIPDNATYLAQLQSEVDSVVGFQINEDHIRIDSFIELYSGVIAIIEGIVPAQKSTVPNTVTPRQIRLALIASGVSLSTIEAGINTLSEPDKSYATITWEYSTEVQRTNLLLNQLAPSLGFSQEDLDALFILAGTL
jgi:hypothetical protein